MSESQPKDQNETTIRRAIRRGGEWFIANQNERFLHYRYDPYERVWPEARHAARELATLWSVVKLANFLEDERFAELAKRGFDFYLPSILCDPERGIAVVGITPRRVKLNYSAFMMLALLESDRPERDELLPQLGRGVSVMQRSDGYLRSFYNTEETTGQDYYPGQAMLALMTLYEQSGDETWLRIVQKAFPYYRNYWRQQPSSAFVPWQTQALTKLYRATGNPDVADFVFEMSDRMAAHLTNPDSAEFFDFSGGIVVAVYVEGLNQSFRLAKDFGDRQRAARYAVLVQKAAEAILALQCPMPEQNEADFEQAALGGFFQRPQEAEMRVDHNQHAVMGLIGACEVGLLR